MRLTYHFEPKQGWINDPNGLCRYQGCYHAFAQHYPHAPKWGPMHWAHAVSRDLIHWEELPIALFPDQPYENGGGCFSGSAVEKDGALYLMYTSVSKEQGQTQSIAVSRDGVHFEKYAGNPVIARSPLDPENRDFRDPKVFPYNGSYRMICGAGLDGAASALLFASDDLLHWEFLGKLFESRDYGPVVECPDLFPLGDRWVLMFSRMDTKSAQFIVGEFDGERFTPDSFQQPECGTDFYAPQTFSDEQGRRLMIGWLYNWTREVPESVSHVGALTAARELSLRGGRICNYPAAELQPLLVENDPCLRRSAEVLEITDGKTVLLRKPLSEVSEVKLLRDGSSREVFLNGGEQSCTFYYEG